MRRASAYRAPGQFAMKDGVLESQFRERILRCARGIIRYGALEAVQVMRPDTESGFDASVVVE
jgi:hypothetical protein